MDVVVVDSVPFRMGDSDSAIGDGLMSPDEGALCGA